MNAKNAILLLLSLVLLAVFAMGANAAVTVGVTETNLTEFNDLTPDFSMNCTGNDTHYNSTIFINGTASVTTTGMPNNTNVEITHTALTGGSSISLILQCLSSNVTGEAAGNSSTYVFEINMNPTITSITDGSLVISKGKNVTFTSAVTDTNSTGNDGTTLFVCDSDSFTTTCAAGHELCNASGTTAPACTYTVPKAHATGRTNYYTFVIDNNNWANTTSVDGDFVIGGYIVEEDEVPAVTGAPVATSGGAAPTEEGTLSFIKGDNMYVGGVHIIFIVLILVLALGYVYVTYIKK